MLTAYLTSNAPPLPTPTQGLCGCSPIFLERGDLIILPPDASHHLALKLMGCFLSEVFCAFLVIGIEQIVLATPTSIVLF